MVTKKGFDYYIALILSSKRAQSHRNILTAATEQVPCVSAEGEEPSEWRWCVCATAGSLIIKE